MERRLREDGEATRNTARSAGRPSERSERLERLVRCATEYVTMGDEIASALFKWHPYQVRSLFVSGVSSH